MTATNGDRPDLVDKAVRALHLSTVPDGPSLELTEATLSALGSGGSSSELNHRLKRRALMIRIARLSGFSAAAVVLVVMVGSLFFVNGTTTVAFGEVIAEVKKARSLTMVYRDGPERSQDGEQVEGLPNLQYKISVQGQQIRLDMGDKVTSIVNYKRKKGLAIVHDDKSAIEYALPDEALKEMDDDLFYQTIEKFSKILPKNAKQLKAEQLNGKEVHVYSVAKCESLRFDGVGEMKVWVDPKSKLPLKIRIQQNKRPNSKPTDRPFDTVTVFDDLVWNKTLNPELFELRVPKGYKVTQGLPGSK